MNNIIDCYVLDDGRIWDIVAAKFVDTMPEGALQSNCPNERGESTVKELIACLEFYGFPKGELKTDTEYASEVREKRNELIAETDYLVMPDYPLPEDKRQAVLTYRQSLRDVPEQEGFPRSIEWPNHPFAN